MSETVLPDFDGGTHPVEFCRVAVAESVKPHAPGVSDPEAFKQRLQLPRHDVVIVQRFPSSSREQQTIWIRLPIPIEILPDVFGKIRADGEVTHCVVCFWSLQSASPR
ncbi:MAG: hypothetical protein ABSE40_20210 [Candidatus Sulfotelmatobacter sp.]